MPALEGGADERSEEAPSSLWSVRVMVHGWLRTPEAAAGDWVGWLAGGCPNNGPFSDADWLL